MIKNHLIIENGCSAGDMEDLVEHKKNISDVSICVFSKGSIWKKSSIGISNIIQLEESDRWSLGVLGSLRLSLGHTKLSSLCSVAWAGIHSRAAAAARGQQETAGAAEQMWSPEGSPSAAGDAQRAGQPAGASGALEDVPPLLSKQGTRGVWREKGTVVEYLWPGVN